MSEPRTARGTRYGERPVDWVEPVSLPTTTDGGVLYPVSRVGSGYPHPIGAYALVDGRIRFLPAVDRERIMLAALATTAAAVLGVSAAFAVRRRGPAIGTVRMGPGGWVSLKGVSAPALRPGRKRPWWARLLGAHRLIVEH